MELTSIVEALLIASEQPLSAEEIARLIRGRVAEAEDAWQRDVEEGNDVPPVSAELKRWAVVAAVDVQHAIEDLNAHYRDTGRAFVLLERAKGWKFFTHAQYGDFVRQLFPGRKPERLSGPAMETLAIIAYRQPITKASIEAVRGVSCDGMLQKLLDRDLVSIVGRADLPGRPLLYATTDLFFEHFGIRSVNDLPNAAELRAIRLPEPESKKALEPQAEQLTLREV